MLAIEEGNPERSMNITWIVPNTVIRDVLVSSNDVEWKVVNNIM